MGMQVTGTSSQTYCPESHFDHRDFKRVLASLRPSPRDWVNVAQYLEHNLEAEFLKDIDPADFRKILINLKTTPGKSASTVFEDLLSHPQMESLTREAIREIGSPPSFFCSPNKREGGATKEELKQRVALFLNALTFKQNLAFSLNVPTSSENVLLSDCKIL